LRSRSRERSEELNGIGTLGVLGVVAAFGDEM
jgi:hypothetical protein